MLCLSGAIALSLAASAEDLKPVGVTVYHYPPNMIVTAKEISGKYIEEVEAILEAAGYTPRWIRSTLDNEARLLTDGIRPICTTGRSYTAERAKTWLYTPFLFDTVPGDIVIMHPDYAEAITAEKDIAKVIRDKKYNGVFIKLYDYGANLDPAVRGEGYDQLLFARSEIMAIQMVHRGRAHYTIATEDQWKFAILRDPELASLIMSPDLGTQPAADIHIVCSAAVGQIVIDNISAAMQHLNFAPYDFDRGNAR